MAIEIVSGGSGNDPIAIPSASYEKSAQSFQDAGGFAMESVFISLSLAAGTPGTITVDLYAADGSGYPTGGILASDNFQASSLASYPSFTLAKKINLTGANISAATPYCFVISTSAGVYDSSYIYVKATLGNPYADGLLTRYDGADWSQHGSFDVQFIVRSADVPGKATSPSPSASATEISTNLTELTWTEGSSSESENVYFGPSGDLALVESGNTSESFDLASYIPLEHGTAYQWRIDSVDSEEDVTTGDTWTFTTLILDPPSTAGDNAMLTVRRLVATAENRFWYEDI